MKATVDAETCVGCGLCVDGCPEVFRMEDGIAVVHVDEVPVSVEGSCREAADGCPVDAIAVEA